jgi:NADH dehydrogenase FAD-containing subunit
MPNIRKETDSLRIVIVGGGFAGVTSPKVWPTLKSTG